MSGDCCCCANEAAPPSASLDQHSGDNSSGSSGSSGSATARWVSLHLPAPAASVDPLCETRLSSPRDVGVAAIVAATIVNFKDLTALVTSAASAPGASPWLFAAQVLLFQTCRLLRRNEDISEAYWGERRGRARVEREMRRIADVQLTTSEGFFVQPVGVVRSCYKQCIGTPRQGLLAPSSRASIVFAKSISPAALDDLEGFSHVWITFKFHLNTNTLKEAKAFASGSSGKKSSSSSTSADGKPEGGSHQQRFTFTAKITPPMLKRKVGVFSTRSPHRPNPIGVTLARIERVDGAARTVHLSACDLVHGTPVLDIKPYVPFYDSIEEAEEEGGSRVPSWIRETITARVPVHISDRAVHAARAIIMATSSSSGGSGKTNKKNKNTSYSGFYANDDVAFWRAVTETLGADVRSSFQTRRGAPLPLPSVLKGTKGSSTSGVAIPEAGDEAGVAGEELRLPFDNVVLHYKWVADISQLSGATTTVPMPASKAEKEGEGGLAPLLNANGGLGHIEVTDVTVPDSEDINKVHGISRQDLFTERLPRHLLEEVEGRFEGNDQQQQEAAEDKAAADAGAAQSCCAQQQEQQGQGECGTSGCGCQEEEEEEDDDDALSC